MAQTNQRPRSAAATRLLSVARNPLTPPLPKIASKGEVDPSRTNVEHLALNHRPRQPAERLPGHNRVGGDKVSEEEPLASTPFRNSRFPAAAKDAYPTHASNGSAACQRSHKGLVSTPNLSRKDFQVAKTTSIPSLSRPGGSLETSSANMKQKIGRHKSVDPAHSQPLEGFFSPPSGTTLTRMAASLTTISPIASGLTETVDSSLNLSTLSGQSSSFDSSRASRQSLESRIPLPKRLTQPTTAAHGSNPMMRNGKCGSTASIRAPAASSSSHSTLPKVERAASLRLSKTAPATTLTGEVSPPKTNGVTQRPVKSNERATAMGTMKRTGSSTLKVKAVGQRVGPLPAVSQLNSRTLAPRNGLGGNNSSSAKVKLKGLHSLGHRQPEKPLTVGMLPVAARRPTLAPEECCWEAPGANGEKEVTAAAVQTLESGPHRQERQVIPLAQDKGLERRDPEHVRGSAATVVKVKPCDALRDPVQEQNNQPRVLQMDSASCDSSIHSDNVDLELDEDEADRGSMAAPTLPLLSVSLVDALANLAVEDVDQTDELRARCPQVNVLIDSKGPVTTGWTCGEAVEEPVTQWAREDTEQEIPFPPEIMPAPDKKKGGASHRRKFLRKMTSLTSMLYGHHQKSLSQPPLSQRTFSKELLVAMEKEHRSLKGEGAPPPPPALHFDATWIQNEVDTALERLTTSTGGPQPARGRSCSIPCVESVSPLKPIAANLERQAANSSEVLTSHDLGSSQRSLSLPKSFLSSRYGLVGIRAALPNMRFPWRKGGKAKKDGSETSTQTEEDERCSTPPLPPSPRPPLPVFKKNSNDPTIIPWRPGRKPRGGTPMRSLSVCDLQRPWSHMYLTTDLDDLSAEANLRLKGPDGDSPSLEENNRKKFRKSLSLRFAKRPDGEEVETDQADTLQTISESRPVEISTNVPGRLREAQKAARSSKCNSGDSGIEVQSSGTPDVIKKMVGLLPLELGSQERLSPESSDSYSSQTNKRGMKRSAAHSHLLASTSQPKMVCSGEEESYPDVLTSEDEMDEGYISRPILGYALWAHEPEEGELKLEVGEAMEILDASNPNWWWAASRGKYGWVPASYLQVAVEVPRQPSRREGSADDGESDENDVRGFVVQELVTAEKDFVKLLQDLVEGFLEPCRRHPDLFSPEQIRVIFGNLEQVYAFQRKFLASLEQCVDWKSMKRSRLGRAFLRHVEGFAIYSEYCQNHAHAVALLQTLYKQEKISQFLETCRLLRNMMRLPLDGFLLTPIQRLCKYPLLLTELKKRTPSKHADYAAICLALARMKEVTLEVNEAQRRLEQRQQVQQWQNNVEHWQGEDLMLSSTKLFHQGELQKLSPGGWAKDVLLGLFDSQLVITKKDIVRRNAFIYKDRIQIDQCQVMDVPDGRDGQFGCQVRNGWKIRCLCRDKWFLFTCRNLGDKLAWLKALQNARTNVQHLVVQQSGSMDTAEAIHSADTKKTIQRTVALGNDRERRLRGERPGRYVTTPNNPYLS